ncbi:MAG: ankyrin repeat domain-containing protein, partial [Bacteroidetes bacterium]|nr:ankyrin repeat domain-containing protein [Bacteroidota bacterium]
MKISLYHRILAHILFISFSITGCGKYQQNFNVKRKNKLKNVGDIKFINKESINTSCNKYNVQFINTNSNKPSAIVNYNLCKDLKKTEIWDIIYENEEHKLYNFINFNKKIQETRLHAYEDPKTKRKILYIGRKGKGGGANSTELYNCYKYGQLSKLRRLLNNGAKLNFRYSNNDTLLHFACRSGKYHLAKLLLEYGADGALRNNNDWTPLEIAVTKNFPEIVKLFKYNYRSLDTIDKNKKNPLKMAYDKDNFLIFCELLNCGANPDFWTNNNNTLLHFACYYGKYKFAKQLLLHGADGSRLNEADLTPLQ